MPTETDVRLTEQLGEFRTEVEHRFGELTQQVERRFGAVEKELATVQTELGLIRRLGEKLADRLLASAAGIICTTIVGAATVGWAASGVVKDVRIQSERLDTVEKHAEHTDARLDRIDSRLDSLEKHAERNDAKLDALGKQIETLLERTAPRSK